MSNVGQKLARLRGDRTGRHHAAADICTPPPTSSPQPYSQVNLDDILASADVTKGALYFHFRSKHALATAVIEHRAVVARADFEQILAHGLPGLETMIDVTYMVAVSDIGEQMARAGFNLLESIGRFDGLQAKVLDAGPPTSPR